MTTITFDQLIDLLWKLNTKQLETLEFETSQCLIRKYRESEIEAEERSEILYQ